MPGRLASDRGLGDWVQLAEAVVGIAAREGGPQASEGRRGFSGGRPLRVKGGFCSGSTNGFLLGFLGTIPLAGGGGGAFFWLQKEIAFKSSACVVAGDRNRTLILASG